MEWLVIKTDKDMQISTQKVKANELNEALNKAEEESNWKDTLYDDCILEGLDIYPNDIQAIACVRWIGQYFEPELPSQDWTCSYCEENIANCCCD
jgi:hypothetical protein